ncbi:hypothetical protein FRC12_003205 [Ceratobasidium sp. 428]|nr:hypothetical protein FRC12_003205 [Ceratobasidium sp. 428]
MPAGSSSGAQKKSQRPVLSSHIAHAHAFGTVPTPGNPSSAKAPTSYFPLPTPPAPLRSFTVPQNTESTRGTEGDTTTYPTSISSSHRDTSSARAAEGRTKQARSGPSPATGLEQKAPRRSSRTADSSNKSRAQSSASISDVSTFQFASAAPFGINCTGSPYVSSPGGHSARSALSIAEIDCFFVQGSRSSTYSAHSPRSQSVSASGGRSDHSTEPTLSSNEEMGGSDMWMSDQAERERQRAERLAFMKARKEAREELRRQKRAERVGPGNDLSAQSRSTWREAIRSQGAMTLTNAPTREWARERKRTTTEESKISTVTNQTVLPAACTDTPTPPSGPGPPGHVLSDSSVDTLANNLTTNLTLSTLPSAILENPRAEDATPQQAEREPPGAPVLNRLDSDQTEIGSPPPQPDDA